MKRLQVRDVMTSDVVVVRLCTPFADVARLLINRRLNAMPVLDGGGAVTGVVSVADLLHKEGHRDDRADGHAYRRRDRVARAKAAACYAAQLMTAPAWVIGPDATTVVAAHLTARWQVRQLPVVDRTGALVGIVSRSDLIRTLLRSDQEMCDEIVEQFRATRTAWTHLDVIDVQVRDGVVSLSGTVERRSDATTAERLAHRVAGVIDVRSRITYALDDTTPMCPGF